MKEVEPKLYNILIKRVRVKRKQNSKRTTEMDEIKRFRTGRMRKTLYATH